MGPLPQMISVLICFALERTVREACPYRFDVLSVENPVVCAVLPSSSFLPVEHPAVFAVLFEAAKAKSALGSNRACLAKNAIAFFACNARR